MEGHFVLKKALEFWRQLLRCCQETEREAFMFYECRLARHFVRQWRLRLRGHATIHQERVLRLKSTQARRRRLLSQSWKRWQLRCVSPFVKARVAYKAYLRQDSPPARIEAYSPTPRSRQALGWLPMAAAELLLLREWEKAAQAWNHRQTSRHCWLWWKAASKRHQFAKKRRLAFAETWSSMALQRKAFTKWRRGIYHHALY